MFRTISVMAKVNKAQPRSGKEIEIAALDLIHRFQPEILKMVSEFDVEGFFDTELQEDTGIEAVYKDLPKGVDGLTDSVQMRCFVSKALLDHQNKPVTRRRLRSIIAHEIGHCYLHVEDAKRNRKFQQKFENNEQYPPARYRPEEIKVYKNPEWQAWRFASALLMPEAIFKLAIERKWNKTMIKRGFDVNPSFVDVRIRELRIAQAIPKGS